LFLFKTMQPNLNEIETSHLWSRYTSYKDMTTKQELVKHYLWLVKFVIKKMNLPTNSLLNDEDFVSVGILGLHESIDRYEQERGVKFESYAIPRIRGIIQDEMRKLDWLSRTTRKKAHDYLHANDALVNSEGREATQEEIMRKLDVSPEQYEKYLAAAAAAKATISLNESNTIIFDNEEIDVLETIPDPSENDYLSVVEKEERVTFLNDYIQKLNKKSRLVMGLYYYEELTFKEIGKVLNVSESRVCQIHTQVVKDLKTKLIEFDNA